MQQGQPGAVIVPQSAYEAAMQQGTHPGAVIVPQSAYETVMEQGTSSA